ncbi:hypothetical protein BHAP_2224 [Bifidobacterium hapali]|uniref:Uncharacterized protein n=1 Tax=Bifidobacterium hapali TaxID=1630172 RepID=A0A261FST2_9BIFI|nr:hypothetical protein [Bifidobacterium hapali]OZG61846.1 hypothetical protein BHAP_2224 [Bifidobacterium hapali]
MTVTSAIALRDLRTRDLRAFGRVISRTSSRAHASMIGSRV